MSLEVTNFMEILVDQFMGEILKKYPDVCKCDKCKSDIAALALNNLPPKYTTSDIGQLYSKATILDSQYRTDIYRTLIQAVEMVQKNPRHPEPVE